MSIDIPEVVVRDEAEIGAAHTPARPLPLLQLRDVRRIRTRGSYSFDLRIPNFNVERGKFVAVVGFSGCGKSTLLDLLALVLAPTDAGCFQLAVQDGAAVRGVDIQQFWQTGNESGLSAVRRRYLGYVLQTGGLLPFLSVRHNIDMALQINRLTDEGRIDRLANKIGLKPDKLDTKPQFLSGGERQRAAILRAIVHHPQLILADEPTAAVDKPRARDIIKGFKELTSSEGTTVVMVTHDEDLVSDVDAVYKFHVETINEFHTCSTCSQQ